MRAAPLAGTAGLALCCDGVSLGPAGVETLGFLGILGKLIDNRFWLVTFVGDAGEADDGEVGCEVNETELFREDGFTALLRRPSWSTGVRLRLALLMCPESMILLAAPEAFLELVATCGWFSAFEANASTGPVLVPGLSM